MSTRFRTAWPSLPPYVAWPFLASTTNSVESFSNRALISYAVGMQLHIIFYNLVLMLGQIIQKTLAAVQIVFVNFLEFFFFDFQFQR